MAINSSENQNIDQFTWLGIFAHPDDETSASAGTMVKWVNENNQTYVVTATGGELGTLGTGGLIVKRENLGEVRESELKKNLAMYGCNPPFMLRYRDQELADEKLNTLSMKILDIIHLVDPDIIVTFGPSGISNHTDHIAIHHASKKAYIDYKNGTNRLQAPVLIYPSLSEEMANQYSLDLSSDEKRMDIVVDINSSIDMKIKGLRNYKSQEDAQEFAEQLNSIKSNQNANVESFAVSPSTPDDWDSYPVIDYLRNL